MGSDIVESGHIIESQPDDSHVHSIPLKLDEENFESLAPQELQNRSHRTYYGFREERQKNVGRRISYRNSNRGHKAATVLFSASRWERQAISRCFQDVLNSLQLLLLYYSIVSYCCYK